MDPHDRSYILDMFDSARFAQEFIEGIDHDAFIQDRKTQSAVIRELLIIGEAAKKISSDFQIDNPKIPWREITGMRNVLVHNYRGIDLDEVWTAATESVQSLIEVLEPMIPEVEDPEL